MLRAGDKATFQEIEENYLVTIVTHDKSSAEYEDSEAADPNKLDDAAEDNAAPKPANASWVGLSEITETRSGDYILIERDNRTGDFVKHQCFLLTDLAICIDHELDQIMHFLDLYDGRLHVQVFVECLSDHRDVDVSGVLSVTQFFDMDAPWSRDGLQHLGLAFVQVLVHQRDHVQDPQDRRRLAWFGE